MKITGVRIRGFRAIDELVLDFTDELGVAKSVATIAGPNGSGKTSLLYAITNTLRGAFGYRNEDVPEPNRDDIRNSGTVGSGWSKKSNEIEVDVDIQFADDEQECIKETLKLLDKGVPPQLDNSSLTVHWSYPPSFDKDGNRHEWFHTDITPSLPNVRSWLSVKGWAIQGWRNRTPGIAELLPKLGGLHFFPQDRDLRQRVGAVTDGPDWAQPARSRPTVHDVLDDFSRRFAKVDADAPENWETLVKKIYDEVCAPKKYIGFLYREDTPEGAPIFADGNHRYPLTHAASGEHVILEYIIELCRFGPLNNSIILIDEPEVHLHPLWLRRLYLNLPDFGAGNQFLLTTHSPELRQRAAADNSLIEFGTLGGDA